MAEREAAMQIHHMWGKQSSSFQEVDGLASGASEHHRPAKAREPGGSAGNLLEHTTSVQHYQRRLRTRDDPPCLRWWIIH